MQAPATVNPQHETAALQHSSHSVQGMPVYPSNQQTILQSTNTSTTTVNSNNSICDQTTSSQQQPQTVKLSQQHQHSGGGAEKQGMSSPAMSINTLSAMSGGETLPVEANNVISNSVKSDSNHLFNNTQQQVLTYSWFSSLVLSCSVFSWFCSLVMRFELVDNNR